MKLPDFFEEPAADDPPMPEPGSPEDLALRAAAKKMAAKIPFIIEATRPDGKTWRCLKEGCGGAMQLHGEKKRIDEDAAAETWRCGLCGALTSENSLIKARAAALEKDAQG